MTRSKKKILFVSSNRSDFYMQQYIYNNLKFKNCSKKFLAILDTDQKRILKDDVKKNYEILFSNFDQKINKMNYRFADILKKSELYLKKYKPNAVIVLGDRYEILSFCLASYFLKIKLIHIHGGEKSLGSLDQGFRDQISQIAKFHLVSNNIHKKNLINMSIDPKKIKNIGSIGLAIIKNKIDKNKNFKKKNYFIITLHPCDLDRKNSTKILLESLCNFKNYFFYFTKPNGEDGSKEIKEQIKNYCRKYHNFEFYENMGKKYPLFLKNASGVIGNSSSGIIEAAGMGLPVINLGLRQQNRCTDSHVLNIDFSKKIIIDSIKKVLKKNFLIKIKNKKSVYSSLNVINKINKFFNKTIFQQI